MKLVWDYVKENYPIIGNYKIHEDCFFVFEIPKVDAMYSVKTAELQWEEEPDCEFFQVNWECGIEILKVSLDQKITLLCSFEL